MSDQRKIGSARWQASPGRSEQEVTDEVRAFYERIQFPGTRPMEQDSLIFLRKFDRLCRAFDGEGRAMRVLDAGCGTGNTTLSLAAQYPAVSFTGLDLSAASIQRAVDGAEKRGLRNAAFSRWNLLEPLEHEPPFDVVLCFGALHHTAEMGKALRTIGAVLASTGVMFVWVYGAYGRFRHTLNMELLAMLRGVDPADDGVELAREFIGAVGDNMAARDLLGERSADPLLRGFFEDATWIADQFLNPNEYSLCMRDILALIRDADLRLHEWIGIPKDLRSIVRSDELLRRFALLSDDARMIALDLLLKMDRYFLVLEKAHGG
ncbi:MAG: class I SAM-dependent methyltransferase [Bacteroidetes bacterium]|nr:class I SAM-dependent methyltransferase [Bacteroidota bacterium]